jgi:hypothetical protein
MEKTLKELKAEALALGIKNVDVFVNKIQLITAIESVKELQSQLPTHQDRPIVLRLSKKEERKLDKKWIDKAEQMRKKLEGQPKVRILVPLEGKETQGVVRTTYNEKTRRNEQKHISGAVQAVTLNGFMFLVPKGMYVEVPEQIAQVIQDKFNQTSEAGKDIAIDRIDPETGHKVSDQL